ncbi:zinc uptake protein ZrgA [Vibrio sinaloensis]|uniref:zinc uptake protein ZrgA n=1 Tax=Photobacterium sp. (strain ATCC 43367) TaxID=379097 RepID=UPI002F41E25D
MYKLSPIAALIAVTVSHVAIAEEGFRQHEAHVHGEVELNIAQDGKELLMEITAPGADVVGFEHAPKNDEQKKILADAVATLNQADSVFTLSSAAGCHVEHVAVTHTLEYHYHCDNIAKLETIDTAWFKQFPATEALKVNVLTDTKQEALRLQPKRTEISL